MTTGLHHRGLPSALLILISTAILAHAKNDASPPIIQMQPKKETPYIVGEKVTLECIATGDPKPTYSWSKDDKLITDLSEISASMLVNVGTLIIEKPEKEKHAGYYQCAAENSYGKALSVRTLLKEVTFTPFKTTEVTRSTPSIGESLILQCDPPYSFPKPSINWIISSKSSTDGEIPQPISNSRRQAVDYDGNLLFANVIPSDDLDGMNYVCFLWNSAWRGSTQGNDQQVIPMPISGKPPYRAPLIVYPKDFSPIVALEGARHKMMCFFAGFPTPNVTWEKMDSTALPEGVVQDPKTGLELIFKNLLPEHAGKYKCCGNNQAGVKWPVCKELQLIVESKPSWEEAPKDTEAADEEDATITCKAKGRPPPTISWSINGKVIDPSNPGERRKIGVNTITFLNLDKTDNVVVQCNASNTHGYIFKNAFLNVKSEPPVFVRPLLAANTKTAIDSKITLHCRAYGVPKPKIVWRREGTIINRERFTIQENGDLLISPVKRGDEGNYECMAENKLNKVSKSGYLTVRNATKITLKPKDQVVNSPRSVTFHCGAETDQNEVSQLNINWKRNGTFIKLAQEQYISKNTLDNSLTIENTNVADSNTYTCVASNQLDSDEFTVTLTVRDKPDPPKNVLFRGCSGTTTTITWEKGKANNAPIDYFIVYSNTSFDAAGVYKQEVNTTKLQSVIRLSHWAVYTFHVVAHNAVGFSERSTFTATCETPASRPYTNPTGVCTENRASDLLVIHWHSMPLIEHNGLGFHYVLSYKLESSTEDFTNINITKYNVSEYIVPNQKPYQLYHIKVSANNQRGPARRQPDIVSGYSGEAAPLEAPINLKLMNGTLNATSAMFMWDAVDTRDMKIRGHFIGYQIQYWKSDDTYEKKRETNIIINPNPEKCPKSRPVKRRARRHRFYREISTPPKAAIGANQVKGHVMNLWPDSKITAVVVVLTSKLGPQSKSVEFNTPEAAPGPVASFGVTQTGSHHFILQWTSPAEKNGKIIGYTLIYGIVGEDEKRIDIDNPAKFQMKLINLTADSSYELKFGARTNAGLGDIVSEDAQTRISSPPDIPGFGEIRYGDSSLNVSWVHSQGKEENPGSEFYVEYRKVGTQKWISTNPESELTWTNVSNLENGANYEMRIVAKNGHDDVSRSDPPKIVRVGNVPELVQTQNIAQAGWFIGIMVALILLLLILIIVCLIKRNRGGKYPVHEKEKLRGREPEKEDEENQFGEYTKTPYMELKQSDDPEYKKSAGSLDSEEKPLESDTDSMAEYDQMDPSKFNEDGSFIGQYGGKTKHDADTTSPSALSTFV